MDRGLVADAQLIGCSRYLRILLLGSNDGWDWWEMSVCAYCTLRQHIILVELASFALCSWSITHRRIGVLVVMWAGLAIPYWEMGCKCVYICILHLYYICGCVSGLQCQLSVAPVTGHCTWIAGHVPYACIPCTPTHCILCTLQGGFLSGVFGHYWKTGDLQPELGES